MSPLRQVCGAPLSVACGAAWARGVVHNGRTRGTAPAERVGARWNEGRAMRTANVSETPSSEGAALSVVATAAPQADGRGRGAAGAAIYASGLTKHFADIQAVRGIDLEVPPGRILGFLGANGSGKSTTVRMLTTLLRPTAGEAWVGGLDVRRHARQVRRAIGVALQEAGLDDLQTGRELLRLQSRLYGVPRGDIEARVQELLRVVELEDDADRRIGTYSGGMKRRLDLASALVHRPGIVFLDEPTTGLDPISREGLWRYLLALNRAEGVTFFLTTQYLEEADRLAHEVAILDAGQIVAQGAPARLKAEIAADVVTIELEDAAGAQRAAAVLRPLGGIDEIRLDGAAVSIYLRGASAAVSRLVRALHEADVSFVDLTLSHPTLDDVFLRATGHHMEPAASPDGQG